MIYYPKPNDFQPSFEVVACFVECDGKILLLQRAMGKFEGGTWALPAGKVEPGEERGEAMLRELFEETGIITGQVKPEYLGELAVNHKNKDFLYHSFRLRLDELLHVRVNPGEHTTFQWYTLGEARAILNLMLDLDECFNLYYPQQPYV